jgi:hypothetical protein
MVRYRDSGKSLADKTRLTQTMSAVPASLIPAGQPVAELSCGDADNENLLIQMTTWMRSSPFGP